MAMVGAGLWLSRAETENPLDEYLNCVSLRVYSNRFSETQLIMFDNILTSLYRIVSRETERLLFKKKK